MADPSNSGGGGGGGTGGKSSSNSNDKKTAYGSTSSTTETYRRTWDREAYAAQAVAREAAEARERKARYEAKLQGKKYHAAPAGTSGGGEQQQQQLASARDTRLDVSAQIGKTQIITGAMASVTGRRGRSAGFYCADCDLTFKDNIQWVEHLNSRGHLVAAGVQAEVKRASLDEVRQRLRYLKSLRDDRLAAGDAALDLHERLRLRELQMQKDKDDRRIRKREERRRKAAAATTATATGMDVDGQHHNDDDDDDAGGGGGGSSVKMEDSHTEDVAALMGFGGFGTTKV